MRVTSSGVPYRKTTTETRLGTQTLRVFRNQGPWFPESLWCSSPSRSPRPVAPCLSSNSSPAPTNRKFTWSSSQRRTSLCVPTPSRPFRPLPRRRALSSPPLPRSKLCVVCHEAGTLIKCSDCGRGFHHDCHLIPITTSDSDRWQCMVCEDLSDIRVHQSRVSKRNPALDFPDQRKCEHVFLTLISTNYSTLLYRQPELLPHSSRYVDIALIRDRLLQKLSPAYLSPSEFVSDVWLLLSTLSKSSNDAKPVARLQRTFQMALRKAFGTSLHPSLLELPPGKEEEGAKVGTEARGSEEVRQTKKRKRKRKEESAEPLMKKICKDEERGGWME
ncbi:hypothetical protein SKAU_G00408010 [Synaphobranchus kaupii]|uniref:PHD-type domain-containing protein n=1 Tax=Synaphobranchus kaupii TaxID=118154 RepID=A0A9Q1ID26_SYNKA|nr:hypothetical protein SKAU_G00408010 [Synaphobranchus kaupii]